MSYDENTVIHVQTDDGGLRAVRESGLPISGADPSPYDYGSDCASDAELLSDCLVPVREAAAPGSYREYREGYDRAQLAIDLMSERIGLPLKGNPNSTDSVREVYEAAVDLGLTPLGQQEPAMSAMQAMREAGLPMREDALDAADRDDYDDLDDDDEPESTSSLTSGKKQRKRKETARGASDPGRRGETEDKEDSRSISTTGGSPPYPSRESEAQWQPIREADAVQAMADAGVTVVDGVELPPRSPDADDWGTAATHGEDLLRISGLPVKR